MKSIFLLPYSPEFNPVERVFQKIQGAVEGCLFNDIDKKVNAVEAVPIELTEEPGRVSRLANWVWIRQSINQLPSVEYI